MTFYFCFDLGWHCYHCCCCWSQHCRCQRLVMSVGLHWDCQSVFYYCLSSPPDEDILPKRVADSKRYHCRQQQHHHRHHHDNLDRDINSDDTSTDKSVVVEANTDSATMLSQHSLTFHSSTAMSRQSTEHKKESPAGPSPTVPEETEGSMPSAHRRSYMQPPLLT